jgi:adenylate kinase family enzyme
MSWYKKAQQKEFIIMRGLPGSGKSTTARQLAGNTGVVLAADDYFTDEEGNYHWNENRIGYAHQWNYDRIEKAIKEGISPVIADNTNVTMSDLSYLKPYIQLAISKGYSVRVEEPQTPWFQNKDIDELTRRNTHDVPRERIEEMVNKWVPNVQVEDILKHNPDSTLQ